MLYGKQSLCKCDQINDVEIGDQPGLSRWALNHSCPHKKESKGNLAQTGEGSVTTEAETGVRQSQTKARWKPPKLNEARNGFSSRASGESVACQNFDFSLEILSSDFWSPGCKRMSFCFFTPPSLSHKVYNVTGTMGTNTVTQKTKKINVRENRIIEESKRDFKRNINNIFKR